MSIQLDSAHIDQHLPLAPLTTLGLGGKARYFLHARSRAAVGEGVSWARSRNLPCVVLGGGSNVLVPDAGFDGLVIHMANRGLLWTEEGREVCVTADAGEPWDDFVAESTLRGLSGIECLSGIPGSVGATPIQNVGAYGQEVSQTIAYVDVLDRENLRVVRWSHEKCAFGYRDSRFKREPGKYVVLSVTFRLQQELPVVPAYRELAEAVQNIEGYLTSAVLRDIVIALRRKKSMVIDPNDENHRSVGSFFTNPILDGAEFHQLMMRLVETGVVAQASDVPHFEQPDGFVKVPAAWLIERAGFAKGYREGTVGISTKHALALVHHGGGSMHALVQFAQKIASGVYNKTGVNLHREPVFFGVYDAECQGKTRG